MKRIMGILLMLVGPILGEQALIIYRFWCRGRAFDHGVVSRWGV